MWHAGSVEFWIPQVGSVTIYHMWHIRQPIDVVAKEFVHKAMVEFRRMCPSSTHLIYPKAIHTVYARPAYGSVYARKWSVAPTHTPFWFQLGEYPNGNVIVRN